MIYRPSRKFRGLTLEAESKLLSLKGICPFECDIEKLKKEARHELIKDMRRKQMGFDSQDQLYREYRMKKYEENEKRLKELKRSKQLYNDENNNSYSLSLFRRY